VAIDWGDEKHAVALRVVGQAQTERTTLEQKPEALTQWIADLRQRFGEAKIAVILEKKRGALLWVAEKPVSPSSPVRRGRLRRHLAEPGTQVAVGPADEEDVLEREQHWSQHAVTKQQAR
jgi:hypothetical protein